MDGPRVRFAPSPTGHLHVGGARTAIFNWLFARRHGGTFLLRIEDTDRDRSSEEATRAILDALEWLGLIPDETPVHQADGAERHRAAAEGLLAEGAAYRCFCESGDEETGSGPGASRREGREAEREGKLRGARSGCPGGCRELPPSDAERREAAGEPFAVRFAVPEGEIRWEDAVHEEVTFPDESVEDFVLLRSDGTPVYNLAVVSDDREMGITHVIRGDDHISNTPKQILLYRALGTEPPAFAHVPMILGPDGERLSKRHGAASVQAFRDRGILPEALVNFLALLGWSPGDDREVMGRDELVAAFGLDRILKKSGVFDEEKLRWLNGKHIVRADTARLAGPAGAALAERGIDPGTLEAERERFLRVLDTVRERARDLHELAEQALPFFAGTVDYEAEARERAWKRPEEAAGHLEALSEVLAEVEPFEPGPLEEALRDLASRREVGAGKLIHPLRLALTGTAVGPGIFITLALMGRERTHQRIRAAVAELRQTTGAG